jgi:hypothetical protein
MSNTLEGYRQLVPAVEIDGLHLAAIPYKQQREDLAREVIGCVVEWETDSGYPRLDAARAADAVYADWSALCRSMPALAGYSRSDVAEYIDHSGIVDLMRMLGYEILSARAVRARGMLAKAPAEWLDAGVIVSVPGLWTNQDMTRREALTREGNGELIGNAQLEEGYGEYEPEDA